MSKILVIHIGHLPLQPWNCPDKEVIHWIDQGMIAHDEKTPIPSFVEVKHSSNIQDDLASLLKSSPVEAIYLIVDDVDNQMVEEGLLFHRNLLRETFLIIRGLYRPLLRKKRGKVFVIGLDEARNEEKSPEVLNAGLAAMVKVMAMELARKGVVANYIQRNNRTVASLSLLPTIFSENKKNYLTGQTFKI